AAGPQALRPGGDPRVGARGLGRRAPAVPLAVLPGAAGLRPDALARRSPPVLGGPARLPDHRRAAALRVVEPPVLRGADGALSRRDRISAGGGRAGVRGPSRP